jgi:hypothetical protein
MDNDIKLKLEQAIGKIMKDSMRDMIEFIKDEPSQASTYAYNKTTLSKEELESMIREFNNNKIRLFVNHYIPIGNIIKFKELGLDEYSYGMNTITFDKINNMDNGFMSKFDIIMDSPRVRSDDIRDVLRRINK